MKRSVWMWVVAALFMSLTMTIGAQVPYVVQPGDTGWELSRQYYNNPTTWQRIVDMNPVLQRPGRVFETTNPDTGEKKIILLLKLGEQLLGLERLNVSPPVAVPIEELVKTESAGVDEVVTIPAKAVFDWLKWLAVAGLVAFVLLVVWSAITDPLRNQSRERELQQDPVTSGPPIIAGGVQPNETERLTRTLEAAAVSDYVRLNPTVDRDTVHVERIGPVEEGTISGEGMVGYADRARARRIDPPQPGYRARFRFPDGREDNLMSLQGCMNPCFYGEGLSGFTFEARQAVVPAPEPPTPAPQPAPHPAMAIRRIREAAQVEGQNTITLGDEVMVFPLGYHLTVDRTTNAITLEANSVRMTLAVKPQAQAETATGTAE